ncbi:transcriptional repressor [Mycobacterium phage Shandong1]|uniref:Immunity repressor n=1 Tax=Mycobacterium phage Shandong1 TaxID=1983447 RepID=A0A1X9SHK7_9CAUD|nr:transcriptional repressor [Mycobacterium phage Shandong1]ARQ95487.1 immunity repressor [Mycobacterium phage Shandong1]
MLEALQMSKTRYYAQRDDGTLIRPDNLVTAALNLDLNPVEILAHFGLVQNEAVLDYADRLVPVNPPASSFGEGVQALAPTVTSTPPTNRGRRGARRARTDVPPLM